MGFSKMSLTRAELKLLLEEIKPRLQGGAVQKVYERDRNTLVFRIRAHSETAHLLVSTRPGFTRAHLVDGKPRQPPHPTAFTMQLRKWVEGGRIEEIDLLDEDRIVAVKLDVYNPEDEGPDRVTVKMIFELTGQHGNAYLLEEDETILGQAHRYRGVTDLEPGDVWIAPEDPPEMAQKVRWGLDDLPPAERSEAIAEAFDELIRDDERREKKSALTSALKSHAKRLKRRKRAVEGDLERAEGADRFKRRAELLQGAYNREIKRGSESVTVKDYFDPDMPEVEVSIDPRLSLQENIDRAFHEYRRLSEATDRIEERLLETMELIDAVEEARAELRELEQIGELEAFEDRVRSEGLLPRKKTTKKGSTSENRLPYRVYKASSGAQILVGRNARANDELTTRHARGRDIWLHARDWPGSHVVLRMKKDSEPIGEDLLDAALLAAHYCRGKEDTLVDVTWTRAKHVRKPKGAAAGLVTHSGGSNIAVRPDRERLQKVLETLEG